MLGASTTGGRVPFKCDHRDYRSNPGYTTIPLMIIGVLLYCSERTNCSQLAGNSPMQRDMSP